MPLLNSLAVIALAPLLFGAESDRPAADAVIHEWGTFTSVADENGASVRWMALSGPSDLPCFVNRFGSAVKWGPGLVRMETPVIYFYAPRTMTFSVQVGFPKGVITEWYPQAKQQPSQLLWDTVQLTPGAQPQLPIETGPSHYYAARETDASPLLVGTKAEKLLFYRGVGDFPVPLRPKLTAGGQWEIRNAGNQAIPFAILFENRAGRIGYRWIHGLTGAATVDSPDLIGTMDDLRPQLEAALVELGLYAKEAHAMLETWRDAWFEEGTRIFYAVPGAQVDNALPLRIDPAPSQIARAFIGRIEILSPWMEAELTKALASGDIPELRKQTRFLSPFLAQIKRTRGEPFESELAREFVESTSKHALEQLQTPAACKSK